MKKIFLIILTYVMSIVFDVKGSEIFSKMNINVPESGLNYPGLISGILWVTAILGVYRYCKEKNDKNGTTYAVALIMVGLVVKSVSEMIF